MSVLKYVVDVVTTIARDDSDEASSSRIITYNHGDNKIMAETRGRQLDDFVYEISNI